MAQLLDATFMPEHARPHSPQWFASFCVSVSQPSSSAGASGCTQLPKGRSQFDVHTLLLQPLVLTLLSEHVRPHAPQLSTSALTSCSQPSSGIMLQSPRPAMHVTTAHPPPASHFVSIALGSAHGTTSHAPF